MSMLFEHSSAPLRTIKEIQFGLFSPEEIKGMSVCHVIHAETMDDARMKPRDQGLNDPNLGSIDRSFKCLTCDEGMSVCPGHFGHIELSKPCFHVGFMTKIKKILECVCYNCGKLKLDENNDAFVKATNIRDPKARFTAVWRLCKAKNICETDSPDDDEQPEEGKKAKIPHGGCGNKQPIIRREGLKLNGTWKADKSEQEEGAQPEKKQLTPQMVLNIFKHISNEDISKMGLSVDYARPEWMVLTVLPVPPPPVRPSISVDGTGQGMRGEDDLTYKLGDIIRANGNVRQAEQNGSPAHIVSEFEQLLQFHVATYMDNDIAGVPQALQKSGRPVKAIRARLKGKEGRLRGNLMGKRVDFSARTVITGDPNLSLDQVGVPKSIARTLTYPEIVTPYNIHKLLEYVKNGPNEHPGAKYVIRDTGERIDLRHHKRAGEITLQYGWRVERHLMDDDFIIFNRQPSLHKESMMGHRVKVMPYSTFRLNLSVTSPYNADFDGDEMNLHVPQSEETRAEVSQLCMVPLQVVSPQKNGPLMGIVQDTLCGIYKLCRKDVFLSYDQVMNILLWVPDWDGTVPAPAIVKPRPRWTGKQMISLVIPEGINKLQLDDGDWCPVHDTGLLVMGGELCFGLLNKKAVGQSHASLIHIIFNEKGPQTCLKFFNGCQTVVNYWLLHHGFSIGIGDTIPDEATIAKITATVNSHKEEVNEYTRKAQADELEPLPGMNIRETFESLVSKSLNAARDNAGSLTEKSLKDLNNAIQMARSGSKGSNINISQMTALVGQQSVEGKRIPFGFKYRSLPHFTKDDYSPEARGFVENSYLRGLTPQEFFFHAMAGREGLIDTAVKTAETGYIQRRLVKALEDVMAKYDGTVRNSLGDVIQFVYGEDGLDGQHIEPQKVDIINCSDEKFNSMVRVNVMDDDPATQIPAEYLEVAPIIQGDVDVQRALDEEYEQLLEDREFLRDLQGHSKTEDSLQLPINILRILENARTLFRIKARQRSDLHPIETIQKVKELQKKLVIVRGDDPLSIEAQENATRLFFCHLRSRLCFRRLVLECYLSTVALDWVLGEIENRFARAGVAPGEMVGVLAAQSIGEPATQMTLNTFHFAGVSSKNVTLGVPRLKEILNVAKNIKTPSCLVFQTPENRFSKETAKALRSAVEHTTMRSITESTEIWYDPDPTTTVIEEDEDTVHSHFLIESDNENFDQMSKWVLRIVFDRKKLLDKDLTVEKVGMKLIEEYGSDLSIIMSDDNAEVPVVRCRMKNIDKGGDEDVDTEEDVMLKRLENHMLDDVTLKGVRGISRAFINDKERVAKDDNGALIMKKTDPRCKEYILDTSGTALKEVLWVDGVDTSRTYSNSFEEIFTILGIEATRSLLVRELTQVLAFDGSYVNHRHLALLCDIMTCRGMLMAITRHGINRNDTGALMRCSFEETVEILLEAAASGELDDCRGISENIMLGQLAPMGTGEFDLFLDEKMLADIVADNPIKVGGVGDMSKNGMLNDGAATPYDSAHSPAYSDYLGSPNGDSAFSPIANPHGATSPGGFSNFHPGFGNMSPYGGIGSPAGVSPKSPFGTSPTSPGIFSPSSPRYSPTSPGLAFSTTSPSFSPSSPHYGGTSPVFSPTSPSMPYSPTSPALHGSGASPTSPFSPTSPSYSPTSPQLYSPTSPANYSPTSPDYSPASPRLDGTGQSPTSPMSYSPTSPRFSPTSPRYSPTSPQMGSPGGVRGGSGWSPTSPGPSYSPSSPRDDNENNGNNQ